MIELCNLKKARIIILSGLILAGFGCVFIQKTSEQLFILQSTASQIISTTTASYTGSPPHIGPSPQSLIEIRASSDLYKLVSTIEWTYSGGYTNLRIPITVDLQISESVKLKVADLMVPIICQERPDCRHTVTIEISNQLPAISCSQTEQVLWKDTCAEVVIPAQTRFRMRGILYDTHPGQWNYIPILELMPSSDVPCLESEFRCEVDSTCFTGYDDYCRVCMGYDKARCACQSPDGNLPEGSNCQYWLSGDVLQSGQCQSGVCR